MTTHAKPENAVKRVRRVNATVPVDRFPYKPIPAMTTPPQNDFRANGKLYDGRDLRPFEGRPGALDFLKYPSRGDPT